MSRGQLLASHTAGEMADLRRLDDWCEIGERRQDLRMAKMTMHIVACLRSSTSGPVRLDEFRLRAMDEAEPNETNEGSRVESFDVQARAAWVK